MNTYHIHVASARLIKLMTRIRAISPNKAKLIDAKCVRANQSKVCQSVYSTSQNIQAKTCAEVSLEPHLEIVITIRISWI